MNIYLITTLFVYTVSLHRGLKSGGTLRIMSPSPKRGSHVPLFPVSCTRDGVDEQ